MKQQKPSVNVHHRHSYYCVVQQPSSEQSMKATLFVEEKSFLYNAQLSLVIKLMRVYSYCRPTLFTNRPLDELESFD